VEHPASPLPAQWAGLIKGCLLVGQALACQGCSRGPAKACPTKNLPDDPLREPCQSLAMPFMAISQWKLGLPLHSAACPRLADVRPMGRVSWRSLFLFVAGGLSIRDVQLSYEAGSPSFVPRLDCWMIGEKDTLASLFRYSFDDNRVQRVFRDPKEATPRPRSTVPRAFSRKGSLW